MMTWLTWLLFQRTQIKSYQRCIFQTCQISFAFIIIDFFVCILGSMSVVLSRPPVPTEKWRLRWIGVNNKAILPCTKSEIRKVIPLLINCCDKVIIIPEIRDKTNTQDTKEGCKRQGIGDGLSISISSGSGLSLPMWHAPKYWWVEFSTYIWG